MGQTLNYTLTTQAGDFLLATGTSCARILTNAVFNYEANGTMGALVLTTCDNGVPALCVSTPVFSINIVDVNEPPVLVFNSSVFLSASARPGDTVGPGIFASDPDGLDNEVFVMTAGNATLFRVTDVRGGGGRVVRVGLGW